MKPPIPENCDCCKREVELSFHHLVPKKMHGKSVFKEFHADKDLHHYGIWVCLDCHKKIHRTFSHYELAEHYYTREALLSHPQFAKFVRWVKKQRKRVK